MNITLIGYRGSGKSTIGRALAVRLNRPFTDTDESIIARAGKSILQIFQTEGEEAFRNRETAAILDITRHDNQIIAAGGGAILRPQNLAAFKSNGQIFWLRAAPESLWNRIQADPHTSHNRPNLTASGGLDEIRQVLQSRTPLYHAAADAILDVDALPIDQAVQALISLMKIPPPTR